MSETRLKGQDAVLRITRGGVPQSLTAIRDFTITFQFEIKSEGYTGETTNRKDEIFNGIAGSFTVDAESQDHLLLIDFLKRRAQRRPDAPLTERVNALATFNFPNGQNPRVLVRDLKFGDLSIVTGSRSDYVNTPITFEADNAEIIVS